MKFCPWCFFIKIQPLSLKIKKKIFSGEYFTYWLRYHFRLPHPMLEYLRFWSFNSDLDFYVSANIYSERQQVQL